MRLSRICEIFNAIAMQTVDEPFIGAEQIRAVARRRETLIAARFLLDYFFQ